MTLSGRRYYSKHQQRRNICYANKRIGPGPSIVTHEHTTKDSHGEGSLIITDVLTEPVSPSESPMSPRKAND